MNLKSIVDSLQSLALAALKKAKTANERIDALPLPMVFKGSLGTGGTISTLPTASSENEGYVYIVITDGTYAGQSAKAGDTFVPDGSAWVLIPAGDEPSVIDDSVTSTALTWSSKKISDISLKKLTYTGDGTTPNVITFPDTPTLILSITGKTNGSYNAYTNPFPYGYNTFVQGMVTDAGASPANAGGYITYNGNEMTLYSSQTGAGRVFNIEGQTYNIYYI